MVDRTRPKTHRSVSSIYFTIVDMPIQPWRRLTKQNTVPAVDGASVLVLALANATPVRFLSRLTLVASWLYLCERMAHETEDSGQGESTALKTRQEK